MREEPKLARPETCARVRGEVAGEDLDRARVLLIGRFTIRERPAISPDRGGARSAAHPVALMTKAGHADMNTTKIYMHMAGVVFRDEADRQEARLLGRRGAENLVPQFVPIQADPS